MDKVKTMNKEQVIDFYNIFLNYYKNMKSASSKHNIKIRMPNFCEGLSENIIRLFINTHEGRNCCCSNVGDLVICDKIRGVHTKIEVKCFSSSGPTSFGPSESWDEIYFLDACNFQSNRFKIYKCCLSNKSKEWSSIQINKSKSYLDVCNEGKRPRINFDILKKQLYDKVKLVFEGSIQLIIGDHENLKLPNKKSHKIKKVYPKRQEKDIVIKNLFSEIQILITEINEFIYK